ncbi:MAG: efflux RND transporter periplasmic adaptor subunit [bacterium]
MIKKILLTVLGLLLLIGGIIGVKALQIVSLIQMGEHFEMPPETVVMEDCVTKSLTASFQSVGSVEAARGVTVASEVSGKVVAILFQSGAEVKAGDPLVQLDKSIEEAQLRSAQSTAELNRLNLERIRGLRKTSVVSQSDMESAEAQAKDSAAHVDQLASIVEKRTIRAPFSGRLGIRQIQEGQFLKPGDPIVTLQALDPVYVNFSLPQQRLGELSVGMDVQITTDALPGRVFEGALTAIEPAVDAATRNINLQATLQNRDGALRQGMFVAVSVIAPTSYERVVIPATAVIFAPYGDSVFVVTEATGKKGPRLEAHQKFIRLGQREGDFVAVEEGLASGERIVTVGGFKLRNGAHVVAGGSSLPAASDQPKPAEK